MKKHLLPVMFLSAIVSLAFVRPKEDPNRLAWNSETKLTWADFKGTAPDEAAKAFTATTIDYDYKIKDDAIYVDVICAFERDKSWVSAKKASQTPAQLKHEQLHFDMAELMARKIRKDISAYVSKDIPSTQAYIDKMNDQYFKTELAALTAAYDNETNHGATDSKQKKWETKIAGELKKFDAFASTKVTIKRQK